MHAGIFDAGIGHVIISRRVGPQIAVGLFLVDVYCLGVKDAAAGFRTPAEYAALIERFRENEDLVEIEPACARKLVESAVAYARDPGLSPHKDCFEAAPLFGDIDPGGCPRDFEFGKDGKPLYISGPFEPEGRINMILGKLDEACGPDGYHFMIPEPGFETGEESEWMDEEDVFEDEDLEEDFNEELPDEDE
ncbi:MAG: hypothetical protein HXY20_09745 [Acidobacteria bacterium]|nr:hypothetical protein [Acidobacteriota bacterium]